MYIYSPLYLYPVATGMAFLLSASIVYLFIKCSPVQDVPLERSSHTTQTPTAGGMGILLSFLIMAVIGIYSFQEDLLFNFHAYYYFLASAFILGVVGFIDDRQGLSYRIRLLFQLLCAGLLVSSQLVVNAPIISSTPDLILKLYSLFSIIALINATNFIDGLNGLLAGCVLIAMGFSAALLTPYAHFLLFMYAILFGSILGFYIFNFHKARIFMGDTGSTFIGYAIAFLSLSAQFYYNGDNHHAWVNKGYIYTLTPLAFIWFDVGFTLCRRIFKKNVRLTHAHRDHMIHILHDAGYSHTFICLVYYFSVALMGALTLLAHLGYISFTELLSLYGVLQFIFCFWVFSHRQT